MEGLKHHSYEERLRNKRRLRASYQCVTKYLEGCKEDGDRLFFSGAQDKRQWAEIGQDGTGRSI